MAEMVCMSSALALLHYSRLTPFQSERQFYFNAFTKAERCWRLLKRRRLAPRKLSSVLINCCGQDGKQTPSPCLDPRCQSYRNRPTKQKHRNSIATRGLKVQSPFRGNNSHFLFCFSDVCKGSQYLRRAGSSAPCIPYSFVNISFSALHYVVLTNYFTLRPDCYYRVKDCEGGY
jgi:hypothetical protein